MLTQSCDYLKIQGTIPSCAKKFSLKIFPQKLVLNIAIDGDTILVIDLPLGGSLLKKRLPYGAVW